ncbi:MAG: phosphoribosylanthranilate isomerase [Burkholderiaceae bacterium]
MTEKTRVKLCGLSRPEDVLAAVDAGADALGFVFYEKSARYVAPDVAAQLLRQVPPFVTTVGLFVNASPEEVARIVRLAPVKMLQFHGDETISDCCRAAEAANRPFMRAIRIKPDTSGADLLKCEQDYRAASGLFAGLLLDTWVDGYGGGGKVFDWSLIPEELAHRVVLSGGLSAQNVAEAVLRLHPYAVDVSSGIERAKGVKDGAMMHEFIQAVRKAEASRQ